MIIVRDKVLDATINCEPFIDVITNDNCIAYLPFLDYYKSNTLLGNSDNIALGLTKQNNQYYYFEHDIVNTPRVKEGYFAYKIYPITNDMANCIIQEEHVCKWEILFNSFINYQKVYTLIKNYSYKLSYVSSYIKDNKLIIPYGISPSNMIDGETVEEYLIKHHKRYGQDSLHINKKMLREIKLKQLLENE